MKIFLILLSFFAGLFLLWLFLLAPSLGIGKARARREILRGYRGVKFAHRGLFGNRTDCKAPKNPAEREDFAAENSLTAFRRAVAEGYGIELDTHVSADGEVVVFHDDSLLRITGVDKPIKDLTRAELAALSLDGTGEGVPTLREVLDAVQGKVPLLIELKEERGTHRVADATAKLLEDYQGPFVIESFDPTAIARFRKLRPDVPTGFLVTRFWLDRKSRKPLYLALELFLFNFLCRPDFIAEEQEMWNFFPNRLIRLFRPTFFIWTVKSPEAEEKAKASGFDGIIFEKYRA